MASPRPGPTPPPRAVDAVKTPASCRTPLGDDAIWKKLREAGFDEETVKRRDKSALISYITKLESEVYDYQHHMGLLILERKELVSKFEQVKASSESAEIAYKREEAKWSSALAEARKREQSLEKLLGIQKECVANIEKALHDNLVESAERKLAYESKIAEARALMEAAQEKSDEAEKKLLSAESLQAEANRTRNLALRTLEDVEAREDELRRRLVTFKSECDVKENEISIQRQAFYESQKTLDQQQERLLEGQTLLNQRDGYIFESTKELTRLEKELEEAKANLEEESRAIKVERCNLDLEVAALASREEVIVKRESMLDKRERELLVLQEKTACKEHDEVQRIMDEHQTLLEKKKSELEAEIEQRHLSLKNELEARKTACEVREVDLCAREIALQEREHAIEIQLSALTENQEDMANKLRKLEEKEQSLSFTQRQAEIEVQNMQKERESILKMKVDLEKTKATLEDEKKEILLVEDKLVLTLGERNELLLLENKLKEEIDSLRAQKLSLVAEADRLKAEKEKFEIEWELIDEKREDLKKEAQRIDEERKAVVQYLKNEHDSIKLEKDNLHNQFKIDVERISCEREEFIREMDHQHSEWSSKIQQEREDFLRDINIQRNELENSINTRREEIETYLREREEAFEQEKVKELQHINSQKEMVGKQLEHVASEMQKLNTERIEIAQEREQREREWAEIMRFTEALDLQCEKLQKQRELLHADREEINKRIQHLKKLEDLHVESEIRALSEEMELNKCKTPAREKCKCIDGVNGQITTSNGGSPMKLLPRGTSNATTSTPDTKSWIRKCTEVIFKHSLEKDSDTCHEKNVGRKMLSKIRDFRSPETDQVHENFVNNKKVSIQELDNFQDLSVTPTGTKSNRHEKAHGTEIEYVRYNLDEQNTIADAQPIVENAQSLSKVGTNSVKFNQPVEISGQKSRTLFSSVNSWLLGRKRPNDMLFNDHADIHSEPRQKQQKRTRRNTDVEGDSSNCMVEPQVPCKDNECEPELCNQISGCEELHAVFEDDEHEITEVSKAKPTEFSPNKLALSKFDILENGKSCKSGHSSLAADGAVLTGSDTNEMTTKEEQLLGKKGVAVKPSEETTLSASDLVVEDNDKLKEQDGYDQVADELEDEDDGSGMSVKEKLWNFLIT